MHNNTRIFISYRRSDSEHIVERVYEELSRVYGSSAVFKDTYSIPLGSNFPDYILSKLSETKVFVLVIGKTFLARTTEQEKPRLFDEHDYLRIEIETALKLGITIIPVMDKGVTYPSAKDLPESIQNVVLSNALELAGPGYFKTDMGKLVAAINKILRSKKTMPLNAGPYKKSIFFLAMFVLALLIAGFAYYQWKQNDDGKNKSSTENITADQPQDSNTMADPADKKMLKNDTALPEKQLLNDQPAKKNLKKDSTGLPDRAGAGNSLSNIDCNISGIEFIDAETFDDNLVFIATGKNKYSFTGRIGHRFDVHGEAIQKGNQLSLFAGNSNGILTLMDCKDLSGYLETGPSQTPVKIVFKKK